MTWRYQQPGHQPPWYWSTVLLVHMYILCVILSRYLGFSTTSLNLVNYSITDMMINSTWPSDARSGSTLAKVMACCLTAPSHYLNQCWPLISGILWHSSESNSTVSAQATILYNEFENSTFIITVTSPGSHREGYMYSSDELFQHSRGLFWYLFPSKWTPK